MKFYQDDCLNVLPKLNDINLIVNDSPYNIGWNYSSKVNDRKKDYAMNKDTPKKMKKILLSMSKDELKHSKLLEMFKKELGKI